MLVVDVDRRWWRFFSLLTTLVLAAVSGCEQPRGSSPGSESDDPSEDGNDLGELANYRFSPIDMKAHFAGLPSLRGRTPKGTKATQYALALYFRSLIFSEPDEEAAAAGTLRRGSRVEVLRKVSGKACSGGSWYEIRGGGFVCTKRGFVVGDDPTTSLFYSSPATSKLLPYSYAKVTKSGAPRLYRLPTAEERAQLEKGDEPAPEVVETKMDGIYLLAVDGPLEEDPQFVRTVRGRVVHGADITPKPLPPMYGQRLASPASLPLAFVYQEDASVYQRAAGGLRKVGSAEKHARFAATDNARIDGVDLVVGPDGLMVERDKVRIASTVSRPKDVPAGERWIHVDLDQQTLVAYDGNDPVYATVVSSGQPGFEPPVGTFRIVKKYVTNTMSGPDPDEGYYEVEEVPWTMYYYNSFALHGAYWHNDFGRSRSHGCTNLAPADARWLYQWTAPHTSGWHGRFDAGTWVHFTSGS